MNCSNSSLRIFPQPGQPLFSVRLVQQKYPVLFGTWVAFRAYYKTQRGYTERSLNSNDGWNVTSSLPFFNMPILRYSNEIRSAVLMIHGDKAHSCYFSRDAYADMVKDNPYAGNKELLLIPGAVHTDLYDRKDIIPFDKIQQFFLENLK